MLVLSFSMVNQKENSHNILYCFLYLKNKIQIVQFSPKIKVIIMFFTCVHLNTFFNSYLPSLELTQKSVLEDFEVASCPFMPLGLNSFSSLYLESSPLIFHLLNLLSSSRLSSNVPPLER